MLEGERMAMGWNMCRRAVASRVAGSMVALACCLACLVAAAERIPETHAQTLADKTVNLPSDLQGRVAVLVLGFSKTSSEQCHGWDDRISRELGSDTRTPYYQMPVLQDVPGFVRGMVIRGIRKDLPAPARSRFLPLLENEAAWKTLAGFGSADDAYVLIVDGTGQVKWRTHGALSPAVYETFKAQLAAAQK